MKAKKLLCFVAVICFSVAGVFAAGKNDKGIDYYRAGLYESAKIYLEQLSGLSSEEQAENYFYLGQSYAAMGDNAKAGEYYKKAIAADPDYPFGYIGEGKLALAENQQKAADDFFKKATGLAKKDPSVHTAIAEAYISVKRYEDANAALDKARKVNKKYSGIFVAEGDMLMAQGKTGEACARYDNAIAYDKKDKVAYLKDARVYKTINAEYALKILNDLIAIDPEYIPAYAEIGFINYDTGFYGKAIDAYEKFITIPGVPQEQLEKYAQLLYFTDRNAESLVEIRKVLEKDPKNQVMLRLRAYNNYKLENYALGLEQMEEFMNVIPADKVIAQDYITYGRLLQKNKQPLLAIEYLQKAANSEDIKPAVKIEVLKDLASSYSSAGKYMESAGAWEEYFALNEEPESLDYFFYGQICYSAGGVTLAIDDSETDTVKLEADKAKRKEYLMKADNAFAQVMERRPETYLGYYWRGNVNALLDSDESATTGKLSGLSIPYYEKALEIMTADNATGSRNNDIINCYKYFVAYYIGLDDSKTAASYLVKIMEVDPNNEWAKQNLEIMKKNGVKI